VSKVVQIDALVHIELRINHIEYKFTCSALVFMVLFEGFEDLNIRSKTEVISFKAPTKLVSTS
jgi:hypothetical protein